MFCSSRSSNRSKIISLALMNSVKCRKESPTFIRLVMVDLLKLTHSVALIDCDSTDDDGHKSKDDIDNGFVLRAAIRSRGRRAKKRS